MQDAYEFLNGKLRSEKRSIEIGLTTPLSMFVFIRSLRTPPFLQNKPFIKKVSLEDTEGVNDNASAFMHVNVKAKK